MTEPTSEAPVGDESAAATRDDSALAVWPLAVLVAAQLAAIVVPGRIAPGPLTHFFGLIIGGLGSTVLIAAWWLTRSSVPLRDRVLGLVLFFGLLFGFAVFLFHPFMLPMPTVTYVVPSVFIALVLLLMIAGRTGWRVGRWVTLAGLVAVLAAWCAVRSEGVDGNLAAGLAPRWTLTAEEEFLAEAVAEPATTAEATPIEAAPGDWTGFRGPDRDGRLVGQAIAADWSANPPREVWRRKVGPGWGSVTIVGGLLFTQEQRGENEVVACYDAATGEPRWVNEVVARFEESAAGPGPRATPTFADGRLYATGAGGDVQCLDAATGDRVWRRNLVEDTSAEIVMGNWWGFASSPLVVDVAEGRSVAIVFAGTPHPRDADAPSPSDSVIAYDSATGEPVWTGGVGVHGYASPQLATLGGVEQVLMSSNDGLESLDAATGDRLWFYEWSSSDYPRVVQPTLLPGGIVILATGYGFGTHAIEVAGADGGWSTTTLWETKKLKPYFNDLVHHEGHLYGFDGRFFTCVDAATGDITWPRSVKRKAAFGHGQALLVEDSGLIVIVTEEPGEIVLIEATPKTLVVRGRIPAMDGKTWNHPVIHGGRLYVRNSEEAVCYELPAPAEGVAAR